MKTLPPYLFVAALALLTGCAQTGVKSGGAASHTKLHKNYRVRTTAYVGKRNAIGKPLSSGPVISAASDWSKFPLGTRFRVVETGKQYVIDDYGSALVGTRTIDLYKSSARAMHSWGARWVNIEILEWGSPRRSLEVLKPRQGYRHIRPMVSALERQTRGLPGEFHRVEL